MHSVPVLLLGVILLGSLMEKPIAEHNPCDCQTQSKACMTICQEYEDCLGCARHFEQCITSRKCKRKRDFESFLRTGTETAKQDDKHGEFSSMEARVGNLKRKWKMPFLEKQQLA